MGADGSVHYEITGDGSSLSSATNLGIVGLGGVATAAVAATAAIAAVGAAAALTGAAIREAMKMETVQVGINTMLKNATLTKGVIMELKSLARDTPFELGDLSGAAKQLIAGGTAIGRLREQLTVLGDIASGAQTDLAGLVLVFNQVRAAGKLMGGDMMQLNQRGIGGLREALASIKGIEVQELAKAMEAGKISADDLYAAFQKLTGAGGTFFNAMKDQSATLSGLISSLKGDWSDFLNVLGQPLLEPAKAVVKQLSAGLQNLTIEAEAFGMALQEAYKTNPGAIGDMLATAIELGVKLGFNKFIELGKIVCAEFGKMFKDQITGALQAIAFPGGVGQKPADTGNKPFFDTAGLTEKLGDQVKPMKKNIEDSKYRIRREYEASIANDAIAAENEKFPKQGQIEPFVSAGMAKYGQMRSPKEQAEWEKRGQDLSGAGMSSTGTTNGFATPGTGGTNTMSSGGGSGSYSLGSPARKGAFNFGGGGGMGGSEPEDKHHIWGFSARRKAIEQSLGVGHAEAQRISEGLRKEQKNGTSGEMESLTRQVLEQLKRIRVDE